MKAIIIDDEVQARKLLQNLILNFLPDVEVVAECGDLPNGVKAIRKHKADLVFLDIEMPGHSGLELLDFFSPEELTFSVIFTTAYSHYAIRAFKLNAIDYLLKPLDPEEVVAAVNRARQQKTTREQLAGLKQAGEHQTYAKIAVPVGQSIHFIDLDTIVYLKADNSYSEIHFKDRSKMLISRTLKNFEDTLQDFPDFFRSHKSYIVNQKYIVNYVKSDGGYLEMIDDTRVPINSEAVDHLINTMTIVKR